MSAVKTLRRDAAENRARLLDAAEIVFAEYGPDASVEEVARVAGVGMGTLYRRFPTKDALIGELVLKVLEDLLALAREQLAVADGSGLERFLYGTGVALSSHRGCLTRLWNDPKTIAVKGECRRVIAELLRIAQHDGRIRVDADLTDIDLLMWSLRGVIETTQSMSDDSCRRLVAIMIAGLRPSDELFSVPPLSSEQSDLIRRHPRIR
jgi:AcrR family transcriptional regulator